MYTITWNKITPDAIWWWHRPLLTRLWGWLRPPLGYFNLVVVSHPIVFNFIYI